VAVPAQPRCRSGAGCIRAGQRARLELLVPSLSGCSHPWLALTNPEMSEPTQPKPSKTGEGTGTSPLRGEAEGARLVQPGEEKAERGPSKCP